MRPLPSPFFPRSCNSRGRYAQQNPFAELCYSASSTGLAFSVPADSQLISPGQAWLHGLERCHAGVEHADPRHRCVHGMRPQLIQGGEVMAGLHNTACGGWRRLGAKQGAVGLLADTDVQPEDSWAIQLGGAVKITIIFSHDC